MIPVVPYSSCLPVFFRTLGIKVKHRSRKNPFITFGEVCDKKKQQGMIDFGVPFEVNLCFENRTFTCFRWISIKTEKWFVPDIEGSHGQVPFREHSTQTDGMNGTESAFV